MVVTQSNKRKKAWASTTARSGSQGRNKPKPKRKTVRGKTLKRTQEKVQEGVPMPPLQKVGA